MRASVCAAPSMCWIVVARNFAARGNLPALLQGQCVGSSLCGTSSQEVDQFSSVAASCVLRPSEASSVETAVLTQR